MRRPRGGALFVILLGVAAAWIFWRQSAPDPTPLRAAVTPVGPHQGRVSAILAEPGQPVITGDVHGRLVVWSDPIDSWVAHDGAIRRITSKDRQLLTVSGDGTAALWRRDGAVQWRRRHREALNDGLLIGDALIVATVRGTVARLGPKEPVWQARGAHGQAAFALVAGSDSVFSAGDDGRIVERDIDAGKVRREWKASVHWIGALERAGRRLIFADGAGQIGVQGADGFSAHPAIKGPGVALAVNATHIAMGGEAGEITFRTIELDGTEPITRQTGEPVLSLAFQGGTLLSGGRLDGAVTIWRVKDGVEVGRLPPEPSTPKASNKEPR